MLGRGAPMPNRTIVHLEIPAQDLRRRSTFYAKAFGWKFVDAGMPGFRYLRIQTGPRGRSVPGGRYARVGPDDRPRNFVGVPKTDPAIRAFTAAGVTVLVPKTEVPGVGGTFLGEDPEGYPLALFPPRR
jgi:uncharacterized protein